MDSVAISHLGPFYQFVVISTKRFDKILQFKGEISKTFFELFEIHIAMSYRKGPVELQSVGIYISSYYTEVYV